jgi:hypothetical protein
MITLPENPYKLTPCWSREGWNEGQHTTLKAVVEWLEELNNYIDASADNQDYIMRLGEGIMELRTVIKE